jgi:hypothetical protein
MVPVPLWIVGEKHEFESTQISHSDAVSSDEWTNCNQIRIRDTILSTGRWERWTTRFTFVTDCGPQSLPFATHVSVSSRIFWRKVFHSKRFRLPFLNTIMDKYSVLRSRCHRIADLCSSFYIDYTIHTVPGTRHHQYYHEYSTKQALWQVYTTNIVGVTLLTLYWWGLRLWMKWQSSS